MEALIRSGRRAERTRDAAGTGSARVAAFAGQRQTGLTLEAESGRMGCKSGVRHGLPQPERESRAALGGWGPLPLPVKHRSVQLRVSYTKSSHC
jgi:hypothetical protein